MAIDMRINDNQAATIIVAAHDSLHPERADYVCDGTDDQVQIQTAIGALPTAGGTVLLMGGNYSGGKIRIAASNVVVMGVGKASKYILATGSNTEAIEVGDGSAAFSGIVVQNLKIDGNSAGGTKNALHLNENITYSNISHVEVYNSSGDGGVYLSGSDNNTIEFCKVHDNDHKGILIRNNSNENIISGNNVYSNGYAGIELMAATSLPVNRNLIIGNIVNANAHGGIITNGQNGNIYHNSIVGNTCNENLDGVGGIYMVYGNTKYTTVTGNTCNANTGNGIQTYESGYNTITGNTCIGNTTYYGVYIQKDCPHNIVSNNILHGNFYGIGLHESKYNLINDNQVVENSYDGVRVLSNSDYNKIADNFLYGNSVLHADYNGISLQSDHCILHHNTYIANTDQKYGLHITATGDNNIISDEIFQVGGVTANLLDEGSGNSIKGCFGYSTENSGTATLVNGTTSIAVNHGLAVIPAAGDIVVTPIEAWGNMTQFYIDTYTSTQFTIHANIDPGQDADFAWKAIVL